MARKRKTSRVRIKDKTGRRGDDREMAISAINNKDVDKKSKMASNNNSHENIVSNPTVSTQRSKEEEKEERQEKENSTNSVNTSMSHGISEVFDSSKYNVMTQMKNSSTMNEEKLKEISSNIEKIKPIEVETIDINDQPSSHIDVNASSVEPSTLNVDQSLEERAALLRGSKKEIMPDQNLVDSNSIDSRLDEEEKSRKVDVEQQQERQERQEQEYNPSNSFTSPYVSLWRESVNMWTNIYTESVRNTAKISEYWLDLFSKPWSGQYQQKYKDKVKVE
jgi:hypothetical protein